MNILKELTKDFQYENSVTNPEVRKLTSGPFRGVWVNRNGFCYCGSNGKTMNLSPIRGYYKSSGVRDKGCIKPWRLTALVWHDKTPLLHLDRNERDKYLNLLAFIRILEKYPDEYELMMNELKTNYYPLSKHVVFNVVTGCLGKAYNNFKQTHSTEYREIRWDYFEEIGDKIKIDFEKFKNELSEELRKNSKGDLSKVTEAKEEDKDPEEELEVCLSDPELGGAPSLKPKVKEDHTHSDICHSGNNVQKENNKMEDYSDIPGYDPNLPMEAQEALVLDEIELRGYRDYTPSPNIVQDHDAADPIDELQELFDRRAQLKKMLSEIEEKIKDKLQ